MTKAELIMRTIDRITDPWTESCEDYRYAELIDLDMAKDIIAQCREEDEDYDEEDRLPAEVTPEIMLEAFNCNVRKNIHALRIINLTDWLIEGEEVCIHNNFFRDYPNEDPEVIPTHFLWNTPRFEFRDKLDHNPDAMDLITIGMNSVKTFKADSDYCWFKADKMQLFSSDHPFHDGVIDAGALAEHALSNEGRACLFEILQNMDDEQIEKVFCCSEEKLWAELT